MLHVSVVVVNIRGSRSGIQTLGCYLAGVAEKFDIARSIPAIDLKPDHRVWIERVRIHSIDRPVQEDDLSVLSA